MVGLLVILLISWGMLYLFQRENLHAIGIVPTPRLLAQFITGFVCITLICLVLIYIETHLKSVVWEAHGIPIKRLSNAFGYHLRSALTEDLIFRGAILYILIERLGAKRGMLISAICFGVYHVFSYGITSERWVLIAYVVIVTGFTGYVWAYAFHMTKSMFYGLGLHLGYNLVMTCFYEAQPYGQLLFSELSSTALPDAQQTAYFFFRGLFPTLATFVLLKTIFSFRVFIKPTSKEEVV